MCRTKSDFQFKSRDNRFLIEESNSYEDLLEVNKNRYPNVRDCTEFAKCKTVLQLSWYQEENVSCGWSSRDRSTRRHIGGKTMFQIDHLKPLYLFDVIVGPK